jgi:EAL and modified HD-GYP domain-containing signal transduction protein
MPVPQRDDPMSDSISDSILIARQPIFDRNLNVYAYELLFRGSMLNESGVTEFNGDAATTQVITNAFVEFGIERVIGNKRAFINLTRTYITGEIPLPFDPGHVVLEVLEDIVVDNEVIEGVNTLAKQGFTVALDDFIYSEELQPLIQSASIIKIDILAITEQELIDHVELLKDQDVKLLAEKVETEAQFNLCKDLGFDYYQGYFFCRPTLIDGKALPDNKIAVLRILNRLQDPDITIDEMEQLIKEDVTLTFKLLRLLNSAAIALPKQVDTIRRGLLFLGLKSIRSWATLISFSDLEPRTSELMTAAIIRAKMSSELAPAFGCDKEVAFMAGLFSLLDAILEQPMEEILNSLPLDDDMKDALLLKSDKQLGKLLLFVINYEQDSFESIPPNISISELNSAYLTATEWVSLTEEVF